LEVVQSSQFVRIPGNEAVVDDVGVDPGLDHRQSEVVKGLKNLIAESIIS